MNRRDAENILHTIGELIKEGKVSLKTLALFCAVNDMIASGLIK